MSSQMEKALEDLENLMYSYVIFKYSMLKNFSHYAIYEHCFGEKSLGA